MLSFFVFHQIPNIYRRNSINRCYTINPILRIYPSQTSLSTPSFSLFEAANFIRLKTDTALCGIVRGGGEGDEERKKELDAGAYPGLKRA